MWITRKRFSEIMDRLELAEKIVDMQLERDTETREQRLWRETYELRYWVNKSLKAWKGKS